MSPAWRGGKVLSSGVGEFQSETSAKPAGSAGILPAGGCFSNNSPAGSQRSRRSADFCKGNQSIITFARRRAGEHYWKALWCVETALVQGAENAMQKRRSL
jgi:hypothetical protein